MKKTVITILAALLALNVSADNAARDERNIDFGWTFHAGAISGAASVTLDDADWRTVDLPHDFQIAQPWVAPDKNEKANNSDMASNVRSRLSARGFKEMGIGWYRYTFTPGEEMKNRRVLVDFEGIMLVLISI